MNSYSSAGESGQFGIRFRFSSRFSSRFCFLLAALVGSCISGCMVGPNNNDSLGSRRFNESINGAAGGYILDPDDQVIVEAKVLSPDDDQFGEWVNIVISRTISRTPVSRWALTQVGWFGDDLYQWTNGYSIPPRCWRWSDHAQRYYARVRVTSEDYGIITMKQGFLDRLIQGFGDGDFHIREINDWAHQGDHIVVWAWER